MKRTRKPWRLIALTKMTRVYGVPIGRPLTTLEVLMAVIRLGRAGHIEGLNYQIERREDRRWEPCFPGMS